MTLHTFKNKKLEIIESLRWFASIYIVIHHFSGFSSLKNITPAWQHIPFKFGQLLLYRYKNVNWGYAIRLMAKLAPISYAVYCMYFLIIVLRIPFIINELALFIIKLVLIFVLSFLLKTVIQPYLTNLQKREKLKPITP